MQDRLKVFPPKARMPYAIAIALSVTLMVAAMMQKDLMQFILSNALFWTTEHIFMLEWNRREKENS